MIGIIGAMEIEIEGLRAKLEDAQSETISEIRFDWGTINGTPCTLAVCGPGKVNAAVCAQTMILRFHPQLVINSGVAGGIGQDVHIKDVFCFCYRHRSGAARHGHLSPWRPGRADFRPEYH